VRRREFITLLGGAAAAWPLAARAQQGKRMRHIGVLMPRGQDNPVGPPRTAALLQELELLGWTAGRNVEIDVRLPARATAAVKNNFLRPERPPPAAHARSVM
jgi:hypothetical protein